MKLLLISNSTNAGEPYLKYPMPRIDEFLGSVREVVFVPYAGITFSYAEYEAKVQARFAEYGIKVRSVHRSKDPRRMIREAQAICVGGGNTFALTKKNAGAGAVESHPRQDQGRHALHRLVGRQQRLLPDDLHHQRHAHRRTGIVQGYRGREVPDQPPTTWTPTPKVTPERPASSVFWSTSRPIRAATSSACAKAACFIMKTENWN